MEKEKYTPGPWRLSPARHALGVVLGGPARQMHNGGTTVGQIAAACAQEWMAPGELEANAALIAAAPELLEAIKYARDCLGDLEGGGPVLLGLCCLLDAAIAKAEAPRDAEGLV